MCLLGALSAVSIPTQHQKNKNKNKRAGGQDTGKELCGKLSTKLVPPLTLTQCHHLN